MDREIRVTKVENEKDTYCVYVDGKVIVIGTMKKCMEVLTSYLEEIDNDRN